MSGLEQYLYQYCQERDIACPLLRPRFREGVKRGANFNTRGHWSPEAHRVAAEEIRDFLVRTNLAQSSSAVTISH